MASRELGKRTKAFALRMIELVHSLPKSKTGEVIGRQLLRSGTSVGANYRSACCAKSPADFVAKMAIVQEEADESMYWMELLEESGLVGRDNLLPLKEECRSIIAMTVASIKTAKSRN